MMSKSLLAASPLLLGALLVWPVAVAPAQTPPACPPGVVFTLDGSGRLRLMSDDLGLAVREACLPYEVVEVNWSHGGGRVLSDLRHRAHHNDRGAELADRVLAHRDACPKGKIVLVGHSAGAAVAIAACDFLPCGAVDRVILLAPAVSARCDLRPALRASRCGVDVFYSRTDMICRGLSITGASDGWSLYSAGTIGFMTSGDECYQNLRQHRSGGTHHVGGHYGFTRYGFLRDCVVPLLECNDGVVAIGG